MTFSLVIFKVIVRTVLYCLETYNNYYSIKTAIDFLYMNSYFLTKPIRIVSR